MISGRDFRAPRLGPGAVYLPALAPLFRGHADLLKVVEVEPQSLWTRPTAPSILPRGSAAELRGLASLPQHGLVHGVGSPVGGTVDDRLLPHDLFRDWADGLDSPWTSEHLSTLDVEADGITASCGFLMPPRQTDGQVALAAVNIRRRTEATGRPFAFETGVNYFAPWPDEMADGDFFAAVAEAANCGILLDLANLWVNARNGRPTVEAVVRRLPLDRVWEVHLAGSEHVEGYWLDAHCGGIDPALAAIAAEIVPDLPNLGAVIFEISGQRYPALGPAAFLREIETLQALWARAKPAPGFPSRDVTRRLETSGRVSPIEWEGRIEKRMLSTAPDPEPIDSDDDGFALYRRLADEFRFGAIAEMLKNTVRLLVMSLGDTGTRDLLARFARGAPPSAYPTDEALAFARFARDKAPPIAAFDDILSFEVAAVVAAADSRAVEITVPEDIDRLLADIASGRAPKPDPRARRRRVELGVIPAPYVRFAE